MNLDTELQRTFERLTDRLRDEFARQLKETLDEVAVTARTDRESAIADAVNRTRAEIARDAAGRLREELAAAERRGHDRAEAQARDALERWEQRARDMVDASVAASREQVRSADLAASERLIDAVRALDRARSLGDVLETLVARAGREAARAGLLLVVHGELRGWRFIGFGPAFDAASTIVVPLGESGIIAEAIRTDAAISSDLSSRTAAPAFAALASGRESLAVPVTMSGEVIAVLYADQGTADEGDQRPPAITWPAAIEVMARHAARCLEAATAIKAMRVLTERPDLAVRRSSPDGADGADVSEASQNDEEESARRYARLLVSEIKLYHEGEVVAGRREHDLATRLGTEIARARGSYEKRVPPSLRATGDFFHEELVRTLANGDGRLLGHTTS